MVRSTKTARTAWCVTLLPEVHSNFDDTLQSEKSCYCESTVTGGMGDCFVGLFSNDTTRGWGMGVMEGGVCLTGLTALQVQHTLLFIHGVLG